MISALVVDDHEPVRALVGKVLQLHGWRVRTAATVAEALDILAGEHVDVLFTDVSLGALSGLHLADEACRLRPGLRVVVMSGHAPEELARQARTEGVAAPREAGYRVLVKPFGLAEIRAVADAVLAARPNPVGQAPA